MYENKSDLKNKLRYIGQQVQSISFIFNKCYFVSQITIKFGKITAKLKIVFDY